MARLFLAITPPTEIRLKLAVLDPGITGLHWTPASQIHLTLAFLGEVTADTEAAATTALDGIHASGFAMHLHGLACFGGKRPHVIFARPEPQPALDALQTRIVAQLSNIGIALDPKPFHPHVTVARIKQVHPAKLHPLLETHHDTEFGSWRVESFSLFASTLDPAGAIHTLRRSWILPLPPEDHCGKVATP